MGFASYLENITERLNEAQSTFKSELQTLRTRLGDSDLADREAVATDIRKFKLRLSNFLDELDKRTEKLFGDALLRVRDGRVNLVAFMNKKDRQLSLARADRDEAISKRNLARQAHTKLIAQHDRAIKERDQLKKDVTTLREEIARLKRKTVDEKEWLSATGGVKKR